MEAILKREILCDKVSCRVFAVLVFVALTALGAFVRIPLPFTPVPLTLQTLFVLLSGLALGKRLGALSQLSYLSLGMLGLPVFSGAGSGAFYLFGPTGGYLWGFVLAAIFLGSFARYTEARFIPVFTLICLADLIILFSGLIWLKMTLGYSLWKLLSIGFFPFVAGDLLKAVAATSLYLKLKPRLQEIF